MLLKDAVAALKLMPAALRLKLNRLTDTQLHFQPQGGYFSVLENVCHLRDIEIEHPSFGRQRDFNPPNNALLGAHYGFG